MKEINYMKKITFTVAGLCVLALTAFAVDTSASSDTFINPIRESGQDPWLVQDGGVYYYCESFRDRALLIWKSDKITERGERKEVWRCPKEGWNSAELWAPELHKIGDKWYVYYAADAGNNIDHRTGVLESVTGDPQGSYIEHGPVYTGDEIETGKNNRWAIDATPLEMNGKLYLVWSGWDGRNDDIQSLFIAEMENPWTVKTNRVKICANNTYDWERVSDDHGKKGLNEGAEVIKNDGKVMLVYSCSGSWEVTYKQGLIWIEDGKDPMVPANWTKLPEPVFKGNDKVHGIGHLSFVKTPDGTENWVIYHSKKGTETGWRRDVRAQKFTFGPDGFPVFGEAIPAGVPIKKPSGE